MCNFKSGIIFKDKVVLADNNNESHADLLIQLGIPDTSMDFVKIELIPRNDEWWIDPKTNPLYWDFHVDQDILPDWFNEDPEKYENKFRESFIYWWNQHVLIDKKIKNLTNGHYLIKNCNIKYMSNVTGNIVQSHIEEIKECNINKVLFSDLFYITDSSFKGVQNSTIGYSAISNINNLKTSSINSLLLSNIGCAVDSKIYNIKNYSSIRIFCRSTVVNSIDEYSTIMHREE